MYQQYLKRISSKGVISTIEIAANVPVCQFGGDLFSRLELKHDYSEVLEIGPDLFLGPSGGIDDSIRHSCNPNCYLFIMGKRVVLYSLGVILAGVEVTYDYSITSTDTTETWKMNCNCGEFSCRKVISGLNYLPEDIKQKYIKNGMVPLHLTNKIFSKL